MSFIVRNSLINPDDGSWPAQTDIHCFYCVHPFYTMPLTAPQSRSCGKYITHGVFCSLPCALKYTDIHAGFNAEEEKMMMRVMARDVFNVPNAFTAKNAIDARNLTVFGGTMSIETFRQANEGSVPIKTLTAPFIQAHMVTIVPAGGAAPAPSAAMQDDGAGGPVIRGLRRPAQLAAPPPPDIAAPALFAPLPSATPAAVQGTFGGASAAAPPKRSKKAQQAPKPALPAHASLLQFISKTDK